MKDNLNNTQEQFAIMQQFYAVAHQAGKCENLEEFAMFTGIGEHTMRRALNGTAVTGKTVARARARMEQSGLLHPATPAHVGNGSVVQSPESQAGVTSADHRAIVSQFIAELAAQRESYERILLAAITGKTDK